MRKMKPFFSKEEIGKMVSYSSFFTFLLIATVLVHLEISNTVFVLAQHDVTSVNSASFALASPHEPKQMGV